MIKVLVSGFEAFGGETSNPTANLIRSLKAGELTVPDALEVQSLILPVGFETAFEALEASLTSFKPNVVLAFGQAGGRGKIEFERIAINLMDADIPDNDGYQPRDLIITKERPNSYFSTLPIRHLAEALKMHEIPAGISNSAGLYVCNYLFYRLQDHLAADPQTLSGFIHVPFLPEQVEGKNLPSISFTDLKRALEVVLLEISKIPFRHT